MMPPCFQGRENLRVWRVLTNLQLLEMIPSLTPLNLTFIIELWLKLNFPNITIQEPQTLEILENYTNQI